MPNLCRRTTVDPVSACRDLLGSRRLHAHLVRGAILGAWLVALVLIRVFSAAQFIEAGIERAELYAGVCLDIDPECSLDEKGRPNLGEEPSFALNLMSHLVGDTMSAGLLPARHGNLLQVVAAAPPPAPVGLLATSIYHPPRA